MDYITAKLAREASEDSPSIEIEVHWLMVGATEAIREARERRLKRAEITVDYRVSNHAIYRAKQGWKKLGFRVIVTRDYGSFDKDYLKPATIKIALFWN